MTQQVSSRICVRCIIDPQGGPEIFEMSYCYQAEAVYKCPGYWDEELYWHEDHFWPQDAILRDLLIHVGC